MKEIFELLSGAFKLMHRGPGSSRALQKLKLSNEVAGLVDPNSPEGRLLLQQKREAAIEYAISCQSPSSTTAWVVALGLLIFGIVLIPAGQPIFALVSALASILTACTEIGPMRERGLIREYLKNSTDGESIGVLTQKLREEFLGQWGFAKSEQLRDGRRRLLRDMGVLSYEPEEPDGVATGAASNSLGAVTIGNQGSAP